MHLWVFIIHISICSSYRSKKHFALHCWSKMASGICKSKRSDSKACLNGKEYQRRKTEKSVRKPENTKWPQLTSASVQVRYTSSFWSSSKLEDNCRAIKHTVIKISKIFADLITFTWLYCMFLISKQFDEVKFTLLATTGTRSTCE